MTPLPEKLAHGGTDDAELSDPEKIQLQKLL